MLHIFLMWFVCLLDFSGDYEDEESSISWIKVAALNLMLQMAVKEVLLPGSYSNRKFFWPCCTTSDLNLTRRTFALVLWEIMLRTVVVWVAFAVHWFRIKVDEWSISHKINCIGSFFISSLHFQSKIFHGIEKQYNVLFLLRIFESSDSCHFKKHNLFSTFDVWVWSNSFPILCVYTKIDK